MLLWSDSCVFICCVTWVVLRNICSSPVKEDKKKNSTSYAMQVSASLKSPATLPGFAFSAWSITSPTTDTTV